MGLTLRFGVLQSIAYGAFIIGMALLAYEHEREEQAWCFQNNGVYIDGICTFADGTYYL